MPVLSSLLFAAVPTARQEQDPRFVTRRINRPYVVDVTGGVSSFEVAPDGEHVAFGGDNVEIPGGWLAFAPSDGGAPARVLTPDLPGVGGISWAGDDHIVALTWHGELLAFPIDGGPPRRMDEPSIPFVASSGAIPYRIAAGGARVVFLGRTSAESVDLFSAPIDGSAPPVQLSPALSPQREITEVEVSPDGARVVFLAGRAADGYDLWSVPADGIAPAVMLSPPAPGDATAGVFELDHAGTRVVFTMGYPLSARALLVAPIDGSGFPTQLGPALAAGRSITEVRVTPGDVAVFRADRDVDERYQLYRVPLDGSGPQVLLTPLASESVSEVHGLTPNGARVVYHVTGASEGLWSAPTDAGAAPTLLRAGQRTTRVALTADSTTVVVHDQTFTDRSLYSIPVDGSAPATAIAVTPPDGNLYAFALSPDSQVAVFAGSAATATALFRTSIHPTGAPAPVRLHAPVAPGAGGVLTFAIGPDPSTVFFRADLEREHTGLYASPLTGPPTARRLSDPLPIGPVGDAIAVESAAGRSVYRADGDVDGQFELYGTVDDGSTPAVRLGPLFVTDGDVEVFELAPDGTHVVFLADALVDGTLDLWSAPTDGSAAAAWLNAGLPGTLAVQFEISRDSTRVLFSCLDGTGTRDVYSISIAGGAPVLLHQGDWVPLLAPDSAHVLYVSGSGRLHGGPIDGSAPPVQLTSVAVNTLLPGVDHAVYARLISPDLRLYSVPYGGGPSVSLDPDGAVRDFELSPDGTWLAFVSDAVIDERYMLYGVPIDGSTAPRVLNGPLAAGGDVHSYAITPDSARVVYVADQDVNQLDNLYSVPLKVPGPSTRLTIEAVPRTNGFSLSRASTHAFVATGGWLRALPVTGEPAVVLAPMTSFEPRFDTTDDGSRVLLRTGIGSSTRFESISVRSGHALQLVSATASTSFHHHHVSGDALILIAGDPREVLSIFPRKHAPAPPPR